MHIDAGWMWGWGLGGLILFVLFWAILIAGVVLLIRVLVRSDSASRYQGGPPPGWTPPPGYSHTPPAGPAGPVAGPGPDALEVLRQRYARGEIDEAEFERRRAYLQGPAGPGGPGGAASPGGTGGPAAPPTASGQGPASTPGA